MPDLPENTIAVFATLCGATVAVTRTPGADEKRAYTWTCLGCTDSSIYPSDRYHQVPEANQHAGTCRSMPLPTT